MRAAARAGRQLTVDQPPEVWLLAVGDQRLLDRDLVHDDVDVGPARCQRRYPRHQVRLLGGEVQQVDLPHLPRLVPQLVLKNDSRGKVPEEEPLQLHGDAGPGLPVSSPGP